MKIKIDKEGMITGCKVHDAVIENVIVHGNEMKVSCLNTSQDKVILRFNETSILGNNLSKGDIISELFSWDYEKLKTLSEGVWGEIIQNFSNSNTRNLILQKTLMNYNFVQIYCSTQGSAPIICKSYEASYSGY